jgi:hypothetical protein
MSKPNVVGVGIGYKVTEGLVTDELCIVTMVSRKVPSGELSTEALISEQLDGVATDVVQVGVLRALQTPKDRWRPAPGGVSIGHPQVTSGTFGCLVRDRETGARLILSNNHVLANLNDAQPGDPILQPGTIDGGHASTDTLAHLDRFCPLHFDSAPGTCDLAIAAANVGSALATLLGSTHRLEALQKAPLASNLVDAALARPTNDADVLDEILHIGLVQDVAPATLGLRVRKSGRTTGFTTGDIRILDASVNVLYGSRSVRFDKQIVTSPMSHGGDSGSLLVEGNSLRAVGLLFAGSEQSSIHNPIETVLDCLGVEL